MFINVDLNAASIVHGYAYMSVSISSHCWVLSVVVNFGVGNSTKWRDHLRLPVANVF